MNRVFLVGAVLATAQLVQAMNNGHELVVVVAAASAIEKASFFKIHRPSKQSTRCEIHKVPGEFSFDFQCKEHDASIVEEFKKRGSVVIFYDRNNKPVGQRETLHGYIGSMACEQLHAKLDQNAKPIAVRAELEEDCWDGTYIRYFDEQDISIMRKPSYHNYSRFEALSETDHLCAKDHVQLAESISLKDKRKKKWCCAVQ